jgi:hypothetical protein
MRVEYQINQPEDIKNMQDNLSVLDKFIDKRLSKYTRSKYLVKPESNLIFNPHRAGETFVRANLCLFNFRTMYEVTSKNHSIQKLYNIASYYVPYFYSYMKTNGLHLSYKKVNKFTSDESVINFIQKLFENDKKITYQKKLQYKNVISSIFGLESDDVLSRIENVRLMEIKNRSYFLYGIDIAIFQDKNNYTVSISNIKSINQLMHLSYVLELLFRQLSNYNELSDMYQTKSSSETDKIIAFDPSATQKYATDEKYGEDDAAFMDMDLDLDMAEFEKKLENEGDQEIVSKDNIALDTQANKVTMDKANIQKYTNRTGKLTFTNYMTQMREMYDPELYKTDDIMSGDQQNKKKQPDGYSRKCDNTQMRQPYILTKEEFDQIDDKESFTGYMKYRDRYYICPRIWDYKAKKPISVKKFIDSGLKSPYTGGEPVPTERKSRYDLGDKYTVFIRKHNSGYWENPDAEKNWPSVLKKSGTDAFPGFMKTETHPKKLCWPCCFSNIPKDYDPNNKEIQAFKKPYGVTHKCYVDPDNEQQKRKVEDYDELTTRNENYIMSSNSVLGNNRYGKLPEHISILLRNNQDIFVISDNNSLYEGSNCFLRKGIVNDSKSFLRSIASIKGIRYSQLIDLIIKNITPSLFVTLNNGNIVSGFKSREILPIKQKKFNYFIEFIKRHSLFCKQYGIDSEKLPNSINELMNLNIVSESQRRAYQRLYIIVSAFQNFLEFCKDDKIIIKRFTLFLDLFSRKLDWLFPKGANILIFYKDTGNIYCNPYIKHLGRPVIMLIMDNSKRFEPIFHVVFRGKIRARGIFDIDHEIDLSHKQALALKEKTSNIELINNSQKRSYILSQLLELHKENCRDTIDSAIPMKFRLFEAVRVNDTLLELSSEFNPVSQVVNIINKCLFLITTNGTLVPVKPSAIILKMPIIFLEDILTHVKVDLPQQISQLKHLDSRAKNKLKLVPTSLIMKNENSKHIVGILTEGMSIVPVKPFLKSELPKTLTDMPIIYRNIYLDIDAKIYETQEYSDARTSVLDNISYLEMLYEQFKFEFSRIISTGKNRSVREDIITIINNNLMSLKEKYLQIYPIVFEVMFDISDLVDENVEKLGQNLHSKLTKNMRAHSCTKLTQQACMSSIFCKYLKYAKKNRCKLLLTPTLLEKYTGTIAEDVLRDPKVRVQIFEDEYTPEFIKNQRRYEKEDDIYLFTEDYAKYRTVYSSSKYHDNFDIYDYKNPTPEQKTIRPPYKLEDGETIRTGTSVTESESISRLKNGTQKLKNVYATVFDKNGKFRAQYQAGPCLFPYAYANNKQLLYECNKDKNEGQRCPTELDDQRRAVKWGFCPADPSDTRKKRKVRDIYATRGKNKGPEFREGKCIFPFRYHPSYDLSWDCVNTKHDKNEKWCATSLKVGQNMYRDLPIAADKNEDIYQKKWNWEKIYKDPEQYALNNEFLRYKTRGFCDGSNRRYQDDMISSKLSLDDFDINKCEKTESKGGYSKKVLVNFAHNVLGIDMNKLTDKNGKKTKKKPELCKVIIDKYKQVRTMHKPTQELNLLQIYNKDPKQCEKGDRGGGYYLTQLRKMAINYFGMESNKAKIANKKQLCAHIKPILMSEIKKNATSQNTSSTPSNIKLSKVYLKNPIYCDKGPKSGGYDIKELKRIAHKYFGISPEITRKEELCKEIKTALDEEALAASTRRSSTRWGKTSIVKEHPSTSSYYGYDDYDALKPDQQSRYSLPSETRDKSVKQTGKTPAGNIQMLRNLQEKRASRRLQTLPSSHSLSRDSRSKAKSSKLKNKNMSISQMKQTKKMRKTSTKKSKQKSFYTDTY